MRSYAPPMAAAHLLALVFPVLTPVLTLPVTLASPTTRQVSQDTIPSACHSRCEIYIKHLSDCPENAVVSDDRIGICTQVCRPGNLPAVSDCFACIGAETSFKPSINDPWFRSLCRVIGNAPPDNNPSGLLPTFPTGPVADSAGPLPSFPTGPVADSAGPLPSWPTGVPTGAQMPGSGGLGLSAGSAAAVVGVAVVGVVLATV